jgi:quercetin dioxygenase-like cupin family protein
MRTDDMGFFGNIWVRQRVLSLGESHPGHKHHFDHVTLLARGQVRVSVEGRSREFQAPTFIVIRSNQEHEFHALSDDVLYYCVFALRDLDGEVLDHFTADHDPLSYASVSE